jgi:hypothetical protein
LYGGHYIYEKGIPSFAWYQLTRMPLWESSFPELSPEFSGQLFPACVMIPWNNAEKKKLPSGDGPESHFPLMDISDEDFKNLAKYLEITSFIDMNFPGAAERLRWLLEQAAQDPGSVSSGCWDLDGDRIRANSWSQAENMLLDAFFRKMPQDLWGKDAVAKCRLTLQAVQANKADQKAVQVIRGKDNEEIAFPVSLYYFNGS